MRTLSLSVSAVVSLFTLFLPLDASASATLTVAGAPGAMAQMMHDHAGAMTAAAQTLPATQQADVDTAAAVYSAQGSIARWDAHEVAIAHHAIPALKWPPMTMTFALPDALAAKQLATGTAVNFSFRLQNGSYTVTAIQPVQP
ncbi:copper-binding protein [Sodalis sp.]|uniref:copper-binding protein n=1 Tax=Sodalis sp. (in: enterobacteria) TaxID=1898979 RepID=UPI003872B2EE